ncbi:ImmA/IrrE family metallo-endopeptidase [Fructilactobacillus frigidiflavus]|uniref:ImmA/IrrE family metallo-endopeptidase n=1 Tax=Fructilactobacillus frigidiflavus TaxID=3242688 RepID=UPI003756DA1A
MERMNKTVKSLTEKFKTSDPFLLAELLDIDVQWWNFKEEPKGDTINVLGSPIILLNDDLKYSDEKYFVCAHELGHAIEHVELANYYISNKRVKNQYEYQADSFAKELLIGLYKEEYGHLPETYYDLQLAYGYPNQSL